MQFLTISPRSQTLFHKEVELSKLYQALIHTFQSPSQTCRARQVTYNQDYANQALLTEICCNMRKIFPVQTGRWLCDPHLMPARGQRVETVPMPPPNSPPSPMSQRRP